jgi:TnpA family transposase
MLDLLLDFQPTTHNCALLHDFRVFEQTHAAWLEDPALRRRVTAGLNKGEVRNLLAQAVFFERLGENRDRS